MAAVMSSDRLSLPFGFASEFQVLLEDNNLYHCHTLSTDLIQELRRANGQSYQCKKITDNEFKTRLSQHYQAGEVGEAQRVADDVGEDFDINHLVHEIEENSDLIEGQDDAPVIRLINAILAQAIREKASDIHIEPFERRLAVRFRVDGMLKEVLSPRPVLAPLLISRLKVMAKLDIAEKRLPQDGRISIRLAGHSIDIRISTIPCAFGERVVLRILDQQAGQLQLEQINMPASVNAGFKQALKKPHGIILVTGPTGSGKTTTLYAALNHINSPEKNILTIEDPVEYLLPGIGQTQVNGKIDMSFARGLRAILRQDPDIVMIGEIRDAETAAIAVQASLTGHLVLSTLHTNTAVGAITRLVDMGIESFLLSSSLVAVLAQRLVRQLCSHCKQAGHLSSDQCHSLELSGEPLQVFLPQGCEQCNGSGYSGRLALFELISVDPAIVALIHDQSSEQTILKQARQGNSSLKDNAIHMLITGHTSYAEIMRVINA